MENKTVTIDEVIKLQKGLSRFDGLKVDRKMAQDPEMIKWEKAKNNLSKEDRLIYDEQNDKLFEDKQKKEREASYYSRHIGPNTQTVFFTFPQAGNQKNIEKGLECARRLVKSENSEKKQHAVTLETVEMVEINYSEYSDIPMFEKNIYAKPYKDGIMLVTNEFNKIGRLCTMLNLGKVEKSIFAEGKIVVSIHDDRFRNFGQIDWTNKNFDEQLIFYVVVPGIVKNKAAKIVFKNNIYANKLIKLFRSKRQLKLPTGDFKHFFDEKARIQELLADLENSGSTDSMPSLDEKSKSLKKSLTLEFSTYPKSFFLKAGYQSALLEGVNTCIVAEEPGFGNHDFWKDIEKYKHKSLEEIKQEYMKNVFPFEKDIELSMVKNLRQKENDKLLAAYFLKNLLTTAVLYYYTNGGTTLCNDIKIDPEKKTYADCLLFWKKINLFDVLFNVLNDKNFPLCMRASKIINDEDIFSSKLLTQISTSPVSGVGERYEVSKDSKFGKMRFDFKNKHILQAAIDSQTGYLMPYDGCFELLHDPIFSFIRFREYKDFIVIVLNDNDERYFTEVFCKKEVDFKHMLWNQLKFNENYSEECLQDIYTKLATCIRDAKVLIERNRSMQYQGRRRPYGCNTDSVYHIYFPRKKYRRNPNAAQKKREKDFFNESRRFGGTRRAHARKLTDDQKPSKKQLLLAKRLDIYIPDGHTFVREAEWGNNRTKREIRYRHTALNGILYYDEKELSEAKKIDQLSPPQFEEYCKEYIKKLGYSVKASQNYDGGIDIRAIKILDNHETEYLIIQCKHWNKPVSPGAMRDFKTACDMEESEYKKTYMFMASGKFSPGAREIAERFNIKLIDGDILLK